MSMNGRPRRDHKYNLQWSVFDMVPNWAQQFYVTIMHRLDALEANLKQRDQGMTVEQRMKLNAAFDIVQDIIRKIDAALGKTTGTAATVRNLMESFMAKTIDEVLAAVRAASTRTDSIIADRAALKKQVDDALSSVTLPADVQAKLDEVFDIETADAAKIDAALNTNVPPADLDPNAGIPAAAAPVGDSGGPVARETTADDKRDQA